MRRWLTTLQFNRGGPVLSELQRLKEEGQRSVSLMLFGNRHSTHRPRERSRINANPERRPFLGVEKDRKRLSAASFSRWVTLLRRDSDVSFALGKGHLHANLALQIIAPTLPFVGARILASTKFAAA